MAETTAGVRRDIELTRERMSSTIEELEQKLNVTQMVRNHPWPALALAVGAGVLLSGSRADQKTAAATVAATKGARSRLGGALDEVVAVLMTTAQVALQGHVDQLVDEVKNMIRAPQKTRPSGDFGVIPVHDKPGAEPGSSGPVGRAD